MKKTIIVSLLVLFLIVAAGFGYLYFSLNSLVKKGVETIGPRITRTDVKLGAAVLSPLSGSGRLLDLSIGNPQGFTGSAITIGSMEIDVNEKTALSKTIVIDKILITSPEISLIGTLTGNNLGKLIQNIKGYGSSKTQEGGDSSGNGSSRKFIVKKVVITGIRLRVAASALDQNVSQTIPLSEIELENLGSGGNGISPAEITEQILVPLITDAIREGIGILTNQGINTLKGQGLDQLNKAVKGISNLFK